MDLVVNKGSKFGLCILSYQGTENHPGYTNVSMPFSTHPPSGLAIVPYASVSSFHRLHGLGKWIALTLLRWAWRHFISLQGWNQLNADWLCMNWSSMVSSQHTWRADVFTHNSSFFFGAFKIWDHLLSPPISKGSFLCGIFYLAGYQCTTAGVVSEPLGRGTATAWRLAGKSLLLPWASALMQKWLQIFQTFWHQARPWRDRTMPQKLLQCQHENGTRRHFSFVFPVMDNNEKNNKPLPDTRRKF